MALLVVSTEIFADDRMMNVIDRFATFLEPVGYGYNTVTLRINNDELPAADVQIEISIANWFKNIHPFVLAWRAIN